MWAFLATPLGRWAAGAVSAVIIGVCAYLSFTWWLASHDRAILSSYVLKSEKAASDALVAKLQRDIILGEQIRAQADKDAEALDIENQKRREADEKAIAANPGGSVVTADDLSLVDRVRKPK